MQRHIFVITSLIILLLATKSYAQEATVDVLYLKNGSIIRGSIVEIIPNETVKIETSDKSLFVFKMEEVDKITKEKKEVEKKPEPQVQYIPRPPLEEEKEEEDLRKKFRQKGTYHMLKVGQSLIDLEGESFAISVINGFQLNEYLAIGVGVEYADNSSQNSSNGLQSLTSIPIFLDMRVYIPKRRVHPMFFVNVGYALPNSSRKNVDASSPYVFVPEKGGLYRSAGGGIKIFANEKFSFTADGGLVFQTLKGYDLTINTDSHGVPYESRKPRTTTIAALRANIGFAFNINWKK